MFRVINTFRDLEDGHLYHPGDPFPHDGREIKEDRINSLLSGQNRANLRLIEPDDKLIGETPKAPHIAKKRRRTKE